MQIWINAQLYKEYIWSRNLQLVSLSSDLVIYDLTILFLVLSSTVCLDYPKCCLVSYDLTLSFVVMSYYFWSYQLQLEYHILVLSAMTWLSFWSFHIWLGYLIYSRVSFDLTLLDLVLSSMTWLFYYGLVSYDLTLLFLALSDMSWLSYFRSCHLWLNSFISSFVSYNLSLLFLSYNLWLDPLISDLVTTTWLSYFWYY